MSYPECPYREDTCCLVATTQAQVECTPTEQQCQVCITLPQKINGVTCGMARAAQIEAGLEPDPKLIACIKQEQQHSPELLRKAHECWEEIHSFNLTTWSPVLAECFYEYWLLTIPEFGCDCKDHWLEITNKYPIVFTTHMTFFISVWYAHNIVNQRLFKPWLSLKNAKKKWLVSTEGNN